MSALLRSLRIACCALSLGACEREGVSFGDARFASDAVDASDAPRAHPQSGEPCAAGSPGEVLGACPEARCLSPAEGFPGGYCAAECASSPCRSDEQCAPLSAQSRVCLRACASDRDCRAREGYVCRAPTERSRPVCIPNAAPVGRRDDGSACFASAATDAGVGAPLAPLPQVRFERPSVSVSRGAGLGTAAEAEPSLAAHPAGSGFALAFVGYDARGYWRAGLARTDASGALTGAPERLRDRDYPDVLTPAVAYDPQGALHLAYVGNNTDRPGNVVRYARSSDGVAPFAEPRSVFDDVLCNAGCAEAALAIGPAPGARAQVYAATLARTGDGGARLFVARALTTDGAFAAPTLLAEAETVVGARRVPSYLSLAAGPEENAVFATWIAANRYNPYAALGDSASRVRLRVSRDGGRTFGPVREVSRTSDAPVEQVPWVASAPAALHVAYVSGGLTGRWSLVLATSTDGGVSFAYRLVHDDPEPCATHAFAALAADPATGDAHVAWIDNRFGPGEVVYARCPADGRASCARNERVSTDDFEFSTTGDASRWHGTRSSLALAPSGAPAVAWSDTRSGGPGVYLSIASRP